MKLIERISTPLDALLVNRAESRDTERTKEDPTSYNKKKSRAFVQLLTP